MSVEVRNITKSFGAFSALNDVSLNIESGELIALLGPSGSGKTTLLRIIAGLDFADPGTARVFFHGEEVTNLPASQRRAGFAFQHYALFRHLTVFENIAFGLRVRPRATRPTEASIRERVMELLKLIQLDPLAHRYPSQLSGGQRQRVALARALAVEPKVLLLDEPFGALDAKVRKELRRWLRQLHEDIHITTIFVTHDQEEALEVADRVVVMNEGAIVQIGPPHDVYDQPANAFVFNFLGNVNLFQGRLADGMVKIGDTELHVSDGQNAPMSDADIYFRPHDVKMSTRPLGQTSIAALIRHVNLAGPVVRIELERADTKSRFEVELNREQWQALERQTGDRVFVDLQRVRVFAADRKIAVDDFSI
ncbi:MAG TPA: sulfate ABC transporter ATP-binding protein [Candidatus Limnocylindria bacterium]|nr:sulfate ABC transporter ATP-binding protein [Candidatus Limnocylindria bacterium]